VTATGFKGYALLAIDTTDASWIRVYTSIAARTADSSRTQGTDPTPGSGVITEIVSAGAITQLISPGAIGYSSETVPDNNIQLAVTNNTANVTALTVTLSLIQLVA
jgi:hypothetical protein